jgi:Tfp pilus assembly protein PilE
MVEILVVMGIFIVLMGIGGVIGFNAYKGYLFRSERSTAVSVLERARSRAMANYYESKHGVCYNQTTHSYELFKGSTCVFGSSDNEIIPGNPNASTTLGVMVFDQLTGNPNPSPSGTEDGCDEDEKSILIKESDKESYICINNVGRINW